MEGRRAGERAAPPTHNLLKRGRHKALQRTSCWGKVRISQTDRYRLGRLSVRKNHVYLLAILILAVFLRAFNNSPSFYSFWVDESTFANRSIYILDHGGQYNPADLYDHPPLFMYVQSVFFKLLGPEWYVARGLAVMLGVLSVLVVFLIGREWKDERLGLMLAALFAVQTMMVKVNREAMIENLLLLLMAASFLAIVKYEKSGRPGLLFIAALFFALSIITKFTALVFLFPLLAYVLFKRLYRQRTFYYSLAIILLVAVPVIIVMLPHGFIGLHLRKTSGSGIGYWIGDTFLDFGHAGALAMTITELNIGLAPFIIFLAYNVNWSRRALLPSNLKRWIERNTLTFFVIVWAAASLIFFTFLTFMAEQYVFTILFPILILMGLVFHRHTKWLAVVVLAVFLVITVIWTGWAGYRRASNDTVVFLQANVAPGDSLIASDSQVFQYYFPDNEVSGTTFKNVLTENATFLVLKTDYYDQLLHNDTTAPFVKDHYALLFETKEGPHAINFMVLKRVS